MGASEPRERLVTDAEFKKHLVSSLLHIKTHIEENGKIKVTVTFCNRESVLFIDKLPEDKDKFKEILSMMIGKFEVKHFK